MNQETKVFVHKQGEVRESLRAACDWLSELGFNYAPTRYGYYQRVFENIGKLIDKTPLDRRTIVEFEDAHLEAALITRVHKALSSLPRTDFLAQIEKVISGKPLRFDGTTDSSRDFLFELLMCSRFIVAGFEVDITGICDIVVKVSESETLFVECKRISSAKQVRKKSRTREIRFVADFRRVLKAVC